MDSQGAAGGDCGIDVLGQASPNGTPSICVRLVGQTLIKPFISTSHSVGSVMMGTEDAWVVGCERR